MSDGVHTFTLKDRNGADHSYLVTEHPAGDGMAVLYDLISLGAGPVLTLCGAALRSDEVLRSVVAALGDDAPAFGVADLAKLVGGVNLDQVGTALGAALATGRGPALTRRILSRTHRDGKSLDGVGLDLAYQANYREMMTAVWKVCAINGFFPELGT